MNDAPAIPFYVADILSRLDAIDAKLAAITVPATSPVPRIAYNRQEFAAMTGRSAKTLKHPKHWRAAGGKKVRGRVEFSQAAVDAARGAKK